MFNWKTTKIAAIIVLGAMLINLFLLPNAKVVASGDEYDVLRLKIYDVISGGNDYVSTDPDIAPTITTIDTNAQTSWSTMNKAPNRNYLWGASNPLGPTMSSSKVSGDFSQLQGMALAYSTRGTSLYQNQSLLADIISGMDWMYANQYNSSVPVRGYQNTTNNWYDWQIASPLSINSIIVQLYSSLSALQISNWEAEVSRQTLALNSGNTGANRVWTCNIIITSGIITKNSAKITTGVNGLSPVLAYVASGEGFYSDGSFLQHTALISYNGGYGLSMLDNLTQVMYIVAGSTWDITDPNLSNVYQWIYKAYEPLFYNDSMMAMVNGRNIARIGSDDLGVYSTGSSMGRLGSSVVRLAYSAPNSADVLRYKSMIKQWMSEAASPTPYATLSSIQIISQTKAIMNDSSITARGDLVLNKQYPNMARAVHRRPDFTFGVSMTSDKVANYELINDENVKGWHTGDGMTYLYNSDLAQYMDAFWPTVDSHRLAGTTVIQNSEPGPAKKNGSSWVGGTDVSGLYGVTGMQVQDAVYSLSANKSWFMFDDEIVNLGAGIQSTNTTSPVETIVENRKLNGNGNNTFIVGGVQKSSALGWSETMSGVSWAYLAGNTAGSDLGYYFPQSSTVKGLRESRTANWKSINNHYNDSNLYPDYSVDYTRNYLTLWMDHGTAPTNGSYSYVQLPNKSSAQVAKYAANPDITILENSTQAQAVTENNLNVTGINFWQDAVKTVGEVTSNKKASVMVRGSENGTEVSVSDPTKANTGTIVINLAKNLGPIAYLDPGVTVSTSGGVTTITVNVSGSLGKSFKVYFNNPVGPVTGYAFNENFNDVMAADLNSQGGWVGDNGGVSANILGVQALNGSATDKSVKLATKATGGRADAYRLFNAPQGGFLTAEVTVTADDNYWKNAMIVADSSLTSNNIAAHIVMENGKMWGYNGGTKTDILTSITPGVPYRLKAVINTFTKKFDIYVNDVLRASQWSYRYSGLTKLDKFLVANSGNLNSSMSFDDAKVSYLPLTLSYLINENFNNMTAGNLNGQNGWVGDNGGISLNTIAVQSVNGSSTEKAVKLATNATGGRADAYRLFNAPQGSNLIAEVTVTSDDNYWKNALIMSDSSLTSSNIATHIVMENGKMWGYNAGTKTDILTSITPGVSYRLKVIINPSTKKIDVYVDGQLRASQWNYRYSGVSTLDKLLVGNSGNLNSSMSFDNVNVSSY